MSRGARHGLLRVFWMVGRVIADPSLDISSPYEVVPLVVILKKLTTIHRNFIDRDSEF
jgi:hypothetical protein